MSTASTASAPDRTRRWRTGPSPGEVEHALPATSAGWSTSYRLIGRPPARERPNGTPGADRLVAGELEAPSRRPPGGGGSVEVGTGSSRVVRRTNARSRAGDDDPIAQPTRGPTSASGPLRGSGSGPPSRRVGAGPPAGSRRGGSSRPRSGRRAGRSPRTAAPLPSSPDADRQRQRARGAGPPASPRPSTSRARSARACRADSPGTELERQDAHPDEVRAVDPLVALGEDGPDAEQRRALGGPVARRAGAVLATGEHEQRDAFRGVPDRRRRR